MDSILTLNQYLGLADQVIKIAEQNQEVVERIPLKVCESYDTKELSDNVGRLFARFRRVRYMYNFSVENSISITPDYTLRESISQRNTTSQVERIVQKRYDELIWASKFYEAILNVAKTLTKQESFCLIETLFKTRSAEYIAEELGLEPKTVYNIRKSYNIKIWFAIEILDDEG